MTRTRQQWHQVQRHALVITADAWMYGEVSTDLDGLQALVGGYIEAVSLTEGHAYVNEEGKLMGLPVNALATDLAHAAGWPYGDVLCGTVVFLGDSPDGDEADVPPSLLTLLSHFENPKERLS